MGTVVIQEALLDVDLIIFDKDGTLIDFERMWGRRIEKSVEALVDTLGVGASAGIREQLYKAIGYDFVNHRTLPNSPLEIGTLAQQEVIVATVLYQAGYGWAQALAWAGTYFMPDLVALPIKEECQLLGDVVAGFERLQDAGIQIAVHTNDNRAMTDVTLSLLGLDTYIGCVVCADDGMSVKPDPEGSWFICQQLGVLPKRTMMVGDGVSDMQVAKNAGMRYRVAIGHSHTKSLLTPLADYVIGSIDDIQMRKK